MTHRGLLQLLPFKKKKKRLGQASVPPLTGRGRQDMKRQVLEERHGKTSIADQLALEKGSSWAIPTVPIHMTAPSPTKDLPGLFQRQRRQWEVLQRLLA